MAVNEWATEKHALAYLERRAQLPRRDEAAAYVEVHIEQGPTLEAQGEPLGVVTGIIGQNKMRVSVEGEAGHAGTVPMEWRRDALAAAAELVLAIERIAHDDTADRMVATVGRVDVLPGATNIIPGRVTFTVDLRADSDDRRRDAVAAIKAQAWEIVEARGVQISFDPYYESTTTPCARTRRRADDGTLMSLCHDVRALSGRHQPQSEGVCQPTRYGACDCGPDRVHRRL